MVKLCHTSSTKTTTRPLNDNRTILGDIMLRQILSLFGLGLLISPSFLHADTITTFTLDGFTFTTPATLTGTTTIDVTTGVVTGIDATYMAGSLKETFTVVSDLSFQSGFTFLRSINAPTNDSLNLTFPSSSLIGYEGGPICLYNLTSGTCPVGPFTPPMAYVVSEFTKFIMDDNFVQTGRLDPISTPEPPPFVRVGSGLCVPRCLSGGV